MKIFVLPDIHGHFAILEGLLKNAGVIDDEGVRNEDITVISVGDLANAVYTSINGDRECLLKVYDWIDKLIIGNHEMGWLFGATMSFNGFYDDPANGSFYRQLVRIGKVVPAVCVPEHNLLISHAGISLDYQFDTAQQAYDAIIGVFETPPSRWEKLGTVGPVPKRYLLAGVTYSRGGIDPYPSIFWKDWRSERMNKSFSQIVGHTPLTKPEIWEREDGTFSMNIDAGAKHGVSGTGVMLTIEDRKLTHEFISWEPAKIPA